MQTILMTVGTSLLTINRDVNSDQKRPWVGGNTTGVPEAAISQTQDVHDRYRSYIVDQAQFTGAALQTFMQQQVAAAHNSKLLEKAQWQQLAKILKYPGEQAPPEGMY
jgi:hypothetical protein